jgi:hypothetical protein
MKFRFVKREFQFSCLLVAAGVSWIFPLAGQAPASGPAPAAPAAPADAGQGIPPARFVSPAEAPAYVERIATALAMARRSVDPFGRNQDPNFRPPQPEVGQPDSVDQGPAAAPVTLAQLVAGIQVTMVVPARQMFFVGDRSFKVGSKFPLRTGAGTLINVQVVSVSQTAIVFRGTENGETAVLRMGGLAPGVQPGAALEPVPGVTTQNPAAPLDLQPSSDAPPPSR